MANHVSIILTVSYLLVLIFGTHFIRTWAFNRHEAVTFECSAIAALLSLMMVWQYGLYSEWGILFGVLLLMFIANAFTQWHFYMKLQAIIKNAFSDRAVYLKSKDPTFSVNNILLTMASVAIMPSFSRFIEESKLFNSPEGPIGLIKSIMKRQRFQKKKYLMRECFADNINLVGPCKPAIDGMMNDEIHVVPGAVHPNDLALGYKDEIIGLVSYDVLGFGALIILLAALSFRYCLPAGPGPFAEAVQDAGDVAPLLKLPLMLVSAALLTVVCHLLRHFGFARYESIYYEFSFSTLVIASFRVFDAMMRKGAVPALSCWIPGVYFIVFLILSLGNKRLDRELHKKVDGLYSDILCKLPFDTETDRTKRRFLNNLKVISEWSIVLYPGSRKRSEFFLNIVRGKKLKEFEEINQKKQEMPRLTEELIDRIVPESSEEVTEDCFRLPDQRLAKTKAVNNILSFAAFGSVFLFIGLGLM